MKTRKRRALAPRHPTGLLALCMVSTLGIWSANGHASDRPYLATSTAVAEDDDDGVWSLESWYQHQRGASVLSASTEYAFNPTTSVQIEVARARDRQEQAAEQELEIEVKHLFRHIARDGWAWGWSASLQFSKTPEQAWRVSGLALSVPYSLSLWDSDGLLHLNAGAVKLVDEKLQWTASAAIERKLAKNTTLFAELARQGAQTMLHGGVRYWVKREKFALDVSLQRSVEASQTRNGVVLGLSVFDL